MRALLPVATAVFALTSVVQGLFGAKGKANAIADAQIHLYSFVSRDCTGEPYTSPYEMKQGECVNFHEAHSLKPRFRFDHADWVKEVNELRVNCKLETFSAYNCLEPNRTVRYRSDRSGHLPKNFNSCLVSRHQKDHHDSPESSDDEYSREHPFYSARFVCGKLENPEHLCTSTIEHTSWSIDSTYGAPHFAVHTATYTGSLSATTHVAARSAAVERFKPHRETKGVWMLHPWSQSVVCYSCYPKKDHDYRKIECRHGDDYPADCGAAPVVHRPTTTTTTSTTTATTTTHSTKKATAYTVSQYADYLHTSSSDSESDQEFAHLDIELSQKKSWHTPVKFGHPFIVGKYACADAEWEKRGQKGKEYIKIQHVHICDHKDRLDSQWIGLPETVVHTTHKTKTSTSTIQHTSTSTSTLTIRHDQL
ncbi:hypothetical protein BU25DRAFT_132743 [Macroventuria anomochaeta]|uniref:Uncharacterized protein n=1 Tax=Macroventuria anomochaeta TaxID=301207 RepID=A0ACB6RSE9_9PLEO|nr:uncharacterized protein BU25DRAFT_132743 [Macroventuria anomochaeta]KAF2624709.1 hypothetical protein BU25DRAFT_132743 [Macroventuria anomochaeta]